ncbi:hypothetical protein J3R83DRAFT_10528, partial [Lanmaoa asiatica]
PDISSLAQDGPKPISPNEKPSSNGENTNVLVIDWDGPDDPKNPICTTASFRTYRSPRVSFKLEFQEKVGCDCHCLGVYLHNTRVLFHGRSITDQLAAQFGIHGSVVIVFTTSVFVLAYGE